MENKAIKTCNICNQTVEQTHKYDHNACVPCADAYFRSIEPPLTQALSGLTAKEKSFVIKECMKDFSKKEKDHIVQTHDAKASCYQGFLEHVLIKKGFS